MKTEPEYYGDRFKADRESFARAIRDDVLSRSPHGKVMFVLEARAMFFGNLQHWPETMKGPLETCINKFMFEQPFTMEDSHASTDGFPIALQIFRDYLTDITDDQAKQLIDILNIGAK